MNDCLVTKLKGTVQNDNLPKLGVLKFYVPASTDQYIGLGAIASSDASNPCKIVGNGVDRAIQILPIADGIVPISEGGYYEITNKYCLAKITFSFALAASTPNDKALDISEFNYCPLVNLGGKFKGNLEDFVPQNYSVLEILDGINCEELGGDISYLANFTSLTIINFNTCKSITGNISSLASLNLTSLKLPGSSNVGGSVEGYVAACVSLGKTSGTISLNLPECGVTWKDATFPSGGGIGDCTWEPVSEGTKITFINEEVII
jgi:hypothetical protein